MSRQQKALHVLMTADAKQVEQSLGRLEEGMKRLEKSATKSLSSKSGFGAFLDPVALGSKFQQFTSSLPVIGDLSGFLDPSRWGDVANKIRDTSKAIEEQGKTAKQFGSSVEGYSGLLYAAGLDAQTLNTALDKLSENIGVALMGGEEMQKAFAGLGLDPSQLAKLDTSEAFLRTVRAMEREEDMYRRLAKAGQIFGKVADDVNRAAVRGESDIRRRMAAGKEAGVVSGELEFQMVTKANEAWRKLEAHNDGLWRQLAIHTAPLAEKIAQDLERAASIRIGPEQQRLSGLGELLGGGLGASYRLATGDVSGILNEALAMNRFEEAAANAVDQEERLQRVRRKAAANDREIAAEKDRVMKQQQEAMRAEEDALRRTQEIVNLGDTAWTKFEKGIAKVNDVAALGKLSWDQYYAGLAAVVNEFARFNEVKNEYRAAEGLEFGSTAEFSARQRFRDEGQAAESSRQNRVEESLRQIKSESEKSRKANEETAEILRKLGLKVVKA